MRILKTFITILIKTVTSVLLIALLAIAATSVSLVYDFRSPEPFSGPDIFDPYRSLDTSHCWKRANFHTHTRVKGPLNECPKWPAEVYEDLARLGYDIVTFSNHNELTTHPFDTCLQVNVYEHGINLFKYHKLVFGAEEVLHFDHLVPAFTFQKQFQLDLLGRDADIIQLNHPLRTNGTDPETMKKLSGYTIMELDSGKSTENEYWDWALSAGHYSFGIANDDLHYPDRTHCIGVRCSFLCCPSASYEDILSTLSEGCWYSMRIPDYGSGNWEIKYERNRNLPHIKDIGLEDSCIRMTLSEIADSIKVTGQDHSTLLKITDSDRISYDMRPEDSYARLTAYFPEGEVIYTNAFARYDSSACRSPLDTEPQKVNIGLTALYNPIVLLVCLLITLTLYKTIFKWRIFSEKR